MPRLKWDLPILQRIIDDRVFSAKQEREWTCLGVVFGDIVSCEIGLDWIAYCDEFGAEPALHLANTSLVVFPRTMILKRVERAERPDLHDLFSSLEKTISDLRSKGC
jgi:hypothetical protein